MTTQQPGKTISRAIQLIYPKSRTYIACDTNCFTTFVATIKAKRKKMASKKIRLDDQLCFKIYTLSRLVVQGYEPLFKKTGITYTQYLVLLVLWERDEQPVNNIATRLLLGINTISPLIKRMEKNGLVSRHGSTTDKRKQIVFLTEKGRQLETVVAQARSEIMQCLARNETIADTMHTMGPMLDTVIDYYVRHREE